MDSLSQTPVGAPTPSEASQVRAGRHGSVGRGPGAATPTGQRRPWRWRRHQRVPGADAWERPRLGIRFHLALATALLVAFALAFGIYSSRLTARAREDSAEQSRALETAVQAARAAFDAGGELPRHLEEMGRAERESVRRTEHSEVSSALAAIRARLAEVAAALGTLAPPGGADAADRPGGSDPAAPAPGVCTLASARAAGLVQSAADRLAASVARRLEVHAAVVSRAGRLAVVHGRHFDACTRVEVTMRALASKAVAVDLIRASRQGRLQRRIDDLLDREMGWVATAQDLRTDSRELIGLAHEILADADATRLPDLQQTLEVYATRLQVYRRLPEGAARAPLEEATLALASEIDAAPALAELRRSELRAEAAVAADSGAAAAAFEGLTTAVYGLAQGLVEEGRRTLDARQQASERVQGLLQGSTIAAGFLVLGLIGYHLTHRVIRPLERLTQAMHQSSRRLARGSGARIAPETLPETGGRRDEVGVMTQALRVLHGTLAEREQSLLEHQGRLHHLAHHDPLTGLPNRSLLSYYIEQAMARARRHGRLLAVGLLDLDGFKAINDRLGHAAGDSVLVVLAHRLRSVVRECDTLARLGGDEIALLLPDLECAQDAQTVMARVQACVREPCDLGEGREAQVSASIGYTLFPEDSGPGDVLMRHADQAMYAAKRQGKNLICRYDAAQDRAEDLRRQTLARVEQALDAGELTLYYQPMVDLRDGRVVGAEALLRWRHPRRGLLGPNELLPDLAGSALADRIGSWVLAEAIGQWRRWQDQDLPLVVGVNVSAEQLRNDALVDEILGHIAQGPPPDGRSGAVLQLEIVENAALDDLARVGRILARCRAAGVRIALDDFGTGYSSLVHVRELPIDTIKIDRSFVQGMQGSAADRSIVSGVVALARALGREVMAEGVETDAQGKALLALGCHLVQGFGIARPMAADRLLRWRERWERDWCERPGFITAQGAGRVRGWRGE
jgi:diguanylate cyclase (GGDEF)-like protein